MEETFTISATGLYYSRLALASFFAILFIQSGLDKVINFRENLSWLVGHFKDTFLSGLVPLLLISITLAELASGLISAYGIVELLVHHTHQAAFWGIAFGTLSLVMLFFGQRIAKDYAGASGLVSYFIVAVVGLLLLGY
jgi:hypothetical protein